MVVYRKVWFEEGEHYSALKSKQNPDIGVINSILTPLSYNSCPPPRRLGSSRMSGSENPRNANISRLFQIYVFCLLVCSKRILNERNKK